MYVHTGEGTSCLENVNISCEEGFGRGSNNFTETRLISTMEFTCNGTIVGWTASGKAGQGTQPPKLQIWRRNTIKDGEEYYHKQGPAIPIDPDAEGVECEETLMCNDTFQCRLNETYWITVQSEVDIVGIELPPLENESFELFFVSGSNISQYVWQQEEVMTNTSLRIGSQDSVADDRVLLYLNVSTGKNTEMSQTSFVTNNTHLLWLDISECAANASICEHICTDTMDSFECSCYEGYTLASDGSGSCLDTDECTAGNHNCQQQCINVPMGGGFVCDCELGYLLNSDNSTCSGKSMKVTTNLYDMRIFLLQILMSV